MIEKAERGNKSRQILNKQIKKKEKESKKAGFSHRSSRTL